jgi:polysaccharide chain length determinant protein (PEP-CTERM system associated)
VQPTDSFSTARRPLDVEDYIDILRRHKGWIFGPFLLCVVASVVGVFLWPDSYESQAIVKITPQQIPPDMVQSSINQAMFDRIQSMEQGIESRAVLTAMINNLGLYQRERNRMPLEDVIDEMKKKINISMIASDNPNARTVPAFVVKFSYEDRHKAQQVVNDLVTKFIDENLRDQSNRVFETSKFTQDELDQAKKKLDEIETKLAAFRSQHNGQLPDQVQSNMQSLTALQSQVTVYEASISRANQDKLQLESNLRVLKDQIAELRKTPASQDIAVNARHNEKLNDAEREVQQLEDTLRLLRQRYSDTYPDIKVAEARLKIAQDKRDALLKEDSEQKKADDQKKTEASAGTKQLSPMVLREIRDKEALMQQTQAAIEARDLEIAEATRNMKRTGELIKTYTAHIESVPLGQKEYDDLLQQQMIAREEFIKLQNLQDRAQMNQEMQNRNQGEHLEILDPASLPINPSQPKRPIVIGIGAGVGLLLGLVVASAREMKDTALKNLKDVRAYTQMPILGSIPLLENDFVVRRRKRLAWLGWTTACLAAVVVMCGSIVYYYTTRE